MRLGLLFFAIAAAVFYRRLEILDSFAKTLAEISKFAGTKNQESDGQKQQNFGNTQFARHSELFSAGAEAKRFFGATVPLMILGQRGMLVKSWLPPFGRDQTTPLFLGIRLLRSGPLKALRAKGGWI